MSFEMPMTASERAYYALIRRAGRTRKVAVWWEGKLRQASSSLHRTSNALRAHKLLRLTSTDRWH